MSATISRPTFYEGEILPAADLVATVDYARDQTARHTRYAHSWGIVTGLELVSTPMAAAGGQSYAVITLQPGLAVDITGREIVVPAAVQLDPTDFLSWVNPRSDTTLLYPVFLSGLDQSAAPTSGLSGMCDSTQSTSTQETSNIIYGSPGGELSIADQADPGVTGIPADGKSSSLILLVGYITWNGTNFSGCKDFNPVSLIGRRYAGIAASEVVSQSGTLLLATHPASFTGPNAIMAVQLQESATNGQLVFGKLNPDGSIAQVLTVTSAGDVVASGKISGAVTPGSVQVQSGMAYDGMSLPLPSRINASDVAAGKVTVHVHTSTRLDQLVPPATAGDWEPFPFECHADDVTLQLHCRLKWRDMTPGGAPAQILPTYCDYTVIVAVPAS